MPARIVGFDAAGGLLLQTSRARHFIWRWPRCLSAQAMGQHIPARAATGDDADPAHLLQRVWPAVPRASLKWCSPPACATYGLKVSGSRRSLGWTRSWIWRTTVNVLATAWPRWWSGRVGRTSCRKTRHRTAIRRPAPSPQVPSPPWLSRRRRRPSVASISPTAPSAAVAELCCGARVTSQPPDLGGPSSEAAASGTSR